MYCEYRPYKLELSQFFYNISLSVGQDAKHYVTAVFVCWWTNLYIKKKKPF